MAHTGDDTIGLRAGAGVESGDFDTFEHAARSCSTLGKALECAARYVHLLNEAADISIVVYGDTALWRYRVTDGMTLPRAANDFVVVSAAMFSKRCALIDRPAREIHFMHDALGEHEQLRGLRAVGAEVEECRTTASSSIGLSSICQRSARTRRCMATFEKYARRAL